jgi:hypothetical protein
MNDGAPLALLMSQCDRVIAGRQKTGKRVYGQEREKADESDKESTVGGKLHHKLNGEAAALKMRKGGVVPPLAKPSFALRLIFRSAP